MFSSPAPVIQAGNLELLEKLAPLTETVMDSVVLKINQKMLMHSLLISVWIAFRTGFVGFRDTSERVCVL